ncbi:MAG: N-acetylmuramoyl-L-alanine amidase [Cypionkella sp.]|nr:N-acetylmuramoyl-L-alanine amidase [Cypionkella sp.]
MEPRPLPRGCAIDAALPSPNFGPRRGGVRPSLIVLHYTAMASCAEARARLCDPAHEVSAHWLIDEAGRAEALVDENQRAWHAGAGAWAGLDDINSHSIGIELANRGDHPFASRQMDGLEALLRGVMARWNIAPHRIIGHSDMAPTRKGDPGARFDWQRLARAGLSVWPQASALAEPTTFLPSLRAFGYPDAPDDALLSAFRLRFRPWARGPIDGWDAALAQDLARSFAVDRPPPLA